MSEVRIAAEPRTEFGKGAARRVRRAGKVPAVLYGHGTEPRHVSLPGHDLMLALKHGGANTLLYLDVNGDTELALAKAVSRDPIKGFLEHIDLLLVKKGEKVTVDVPVVLMGEVNREGMLDHQLMTVSLEAEATSIPERVEVSVEGLDVGSAIYARDLQLPPGSTLATDPDALVAHVVPKPTAEQVDAELAEATADLTGGPVVVEPTEAVGQEADSEQQAAESGG